MSVRYLTISKFAAETGYSERAVRGKIHDGMWPQDVIWKKAADGRILIDVKGYEEWVETGGEFGRLRTAASKSRSRTAASSAESGFEVGPLLLT
jgi:hypothetical protein